MELSIYTSADLSYANRKVYKSVVRAPDITIDIKHFDYGDMNNASVVLTNQSNINPREITYVIVKEVGEDDLHYWVTTIEFISKNKYRLGLYRNVWVNANLDNTYGLIKRGTASNIANYKANTMKVNQVKTKEIYITDEYTTVTDGAISKPSSWGILYTAQLDDDASNPSIQLETPPYVVSGGVIQEGGYYSNVSSSGNRRFRNMYDRLVIIAQSAGTEVAIGAYNITYDLIISQSGAKSIRITNITIGKDMSLEIPVDLPVATGVQLSNHLFNTGGGPFRRYLGPSTTIFLKTKINNNTTSPTTSDVSLLVLLLLTMDIPITQNFTNLDTPNSLVNAPPANITVDSTEYVYESPATVTSNDNAIIEVEGQYYRTSVSRTNIAKTINENIEKVIQVTSNIIDSNAVSLAQFYTTINPDIGKVEVAFGALNETGITTLNGYSGPLVAQESYVINTHNYSYAKLDNYSITLDKAKLNNTLMLSQPYGIIAMPLFDTRVKVGGVITETTGVDNQKTYYKLISKYSGGAAPFIIDAQIIPYAPTVFKENLKTDNGVYIDYTNMTDIIASKTGTYKGTPIVMLSNADINLDYYTNLNPYTDIQKEYTCRTYRLQSPSQDAAFDFKYYDYNRYATPFKIDETTVADTNIQVDITLKPFGVYMHAKPCCKDYSLVATREFDDISGMVCGQGIFQSSMTSSAFESYKRDNSLYSDIQERKIETLSIDQRTERVTEIVGGAIDTAQATAMGAMAGGSMGGMAGAAIGGALGGAATATAYHLQVTANDELREREMADARYFYNANLQTIKNLPNTLNRVSGMNQDILNHFCIYLEVYDCTAEEREIYDTLTNLTGNYLEINDKIGNYLIHGKYIHASIFTSDQKQEIVEAIKNDLNRGVYYYESI